MARCNKCNGSGQIATSSLGLKDLFYNNGGYRKCPKCQGSGEYTPPNSGRSNSSGYSPRSSQPRKESAWREKTCPGYGSTYCANTIKYRTDWDNIPNLCGECRQKEKNASRPQREKQPERERTQQTSQWLTKPCGRAKCYQTIRYLPTWDHIPNFCKDCKAEMQRLNQRYETTDRSYTMPGMGQTIGQMGGVEGLHYPRQGKIHCIVFQGKGDDDQHYAWDYDVVKDEVLGQVYMHPNNPGGRR